MSIETVQKRRFLETIYKMYYSLGSEPSLQEVSNLFGKYFSRFRPGESIPIPYGDLNASSYVDVDRINRILIHAGFNIDILYENYYEEIEKLYELTSAFKFRMDSLRSKRAELEKTIDDKLFAINNTNGYFYAYTEAFNNTLNTDLSNTSAIVDTSSKKAYLPKESSDLFNYVGNVINRAPNADLFLYLDGELKESMEAVDISNAFDGLNNSEFKFIFNSPNIGVCTLKIVIPVSILNSETNGISLVEGKIRSQKPVETSVFIVDPLDRTNSLYFSNQNSSDYDNFSFNFQMTGASFVELYLTKVEPDYVETADSNMRYVYDFRIDELIITAPYYSSFARYVSAPIGLPNVQNHNLAIDEVVFDADEQVPPGTSIDYYIAADDGLQRDASAYSWISISPFSAKDPRETSIVKFNGTNFVESKLIDPVNSSIESTVSNMTRIPRTLQYKNPIEQSAGNYSIYRLAKFPKGSAPYEPFILESVDRNQIDVMYVAGTALDKLAWQQVVSRTRNDIVPTVNFATVSSNSEFYQAQNIAYGSIYLRVNIFMEQPFAITRNFLKSLSAQYWDVSVYLNGIDISTGGSLSAGVLTASLTWNFNRGQNTIVIIINKSTNNTSGVQAPFNGSISLMDDMSLLDIPNSRVYKNYLSSVKIEDLKTLHSNIDNVFSVIDWENNKEIVYRRTEAIKDGSRVYYYSNNDDRPNFVRIRADFSRGADAYISPALKSYTLKFKR